MKTLVRDLGDKVEVSDDGKRWRAWWIFVAVILVLLSSENGTYCDCGEYPHNEEFEVFLKFSHLLKKC